MFKAFNEFVELRTKIATVFPFLIMSFYYIYKNDRLNDVLSLFIFFIALLFFDMATTGLNSFVSLTKAQKKNDIDNKLVKYIDSKVISYNFLIFVLVFLIIAGLILSFYLVYLTNYYVLLFGVVAFFIAASYSYGPIPIFRTPLGELYSGFADGIIIPFIVIATQTSNFGISFNDFILSFDLLEIFNYLIVALPLFLIVANIMLANNICDAEHDLLNKRYTLPVIAGKKISLLIFKYSYILSIIIILFAAIVNILPIYFIIMILLLFPVLKNVKLFSQDLVKSVSFRYALQNFKIISVSYLFLLIIAVLIN